MKLQLMIHEYHDYQWRKEQARLRDSLEGIGEVLEQLGGRRRVSVSFALLTPEDLAARAGRAAVAPSFSQEHGMHFDGQIELDTESGRRPVTFTVIDAPCYRTGYDDTAAARHPVELLRDLEAMRRRMMRRDVQSDHAVRLCQAHIAGAYGYQNRAAWSGIIREAPEETWPGEEREGLRLLSLLEGFRVSEQCEKTQNPFWVLEQCQEIVAFAAGQEQDWRRLLDGRTGVERVPLFSCGWEKHTCMIRPYVEEWCGENGVACRSDRDQLVVQQAGQWLPLDFRCGKRSMTVYTAQPGQLPELVERQEGEGAITQEL